MPIRFLVAVVAVVVVGAAPASGQGVPPLPADAPGVAPLDVQPERALSLRDVPYAPTGERIRTGVFRVWENRARRAGRLLELDVVVLPATGDDPAPDPVFVLHGGPGVSAAEGTGRYIGSWMRAQRDVVLVSQRGTGGNNRLACAMAHHDGDLQTYLGPLFDRDAFIACRDALAARFDLTQFSTPIAMDDLNDVRRGLGYDRINLVGGSYGSRAALIYLRRHGDTVRTATLNGIAPLAFTNPLYHAAAAQRAVDLIFAECADDPACAARFPNLAAELDAVLARLERAPGRAMVAHPVTGVREEVALDRDGFADTLRVLMYYDSRRIPWLVHEAWLGNYDVFAAAGVEQSRWLRNAIAFGMLLCVTCAEDVDRIDRTLIDPLTRDTFAGDVRVRAQIDVCSFWPRSALDEGFGDPVRSDVPVLLLSGTLDPVTPPEWGDRAAASLPNALHLIAPGAHGLEGACIDSIRRAFLEQGRIDAIDTSCVKELRLGPFTLP